MQIPVLVEPVANNGYRVSCRSPIELAAEGATRDEALRNLEEQLRQRLRDGVEVAAVEVAALPVENPWVKYAGMFKDNPMFDEVLRIMEENRKKDDADPDYL